LEFIIAKNLTLKNRFVKEKRFFLQKNRFFLYRRQKETAQSAMPSLTYILMLYALTGLYPLILPLLYFPASL